MNYSGKCESEALTLLYFFYLIANLKNLAKIDTFYIIVWVGVIYIGENFVEVVWRIGVRIL